VNDEIKIGKEKEATQGKVDDRQERNSGQENLWRRKEKAFLFSIDCFQTSS
jgi:hypothetical protein